MNTDPISIAVEAQKEGFAYITNLLNGVLPKGIRFEEGNANASLDNAMYRMRQALPALRTMSPGVYPPEDRMLHPWILGFINGLANDPIRVCVVRDHVHEDLKQMVDFLGQMDWDEENWTKCISQPVHEYQQFYLNMHLDRDPIIEIQNKELASLIGVTPKTISSLKSKKAFRFEFSGRQKIAVRQSEINRLRDRYKK